MQKEGLQNSKPLIDMNLSNDWRDEDQRLYSKKHLAINNQDVICFIGCNGAGKTTLLEQAANHLHKLGYADIKDDFNPFSLLLSKQKDPKGYVIDFNREFEIFKSEEQAFFDKASRIFASTGESLIDRFCEAAQLTAKYSTKAKKSNIPLIILFDDCDVGTSIDMQDDIVNFINLLRNDLAKRKIEFAILLTANSYELCRTFRCIDCNTLSDKSFKTYKSYKNFVMRSRKRKDKRNGNRSDK